MTRYEEALRRRHRPAHAALTAESHAAFFVPHLRPGLLDQGPRLDRALEVASAMRPDAAGCESSAFVERAVERGVATADEMAGFAGARRTRGGHPGAFLARPWCEAIGFAD